MTESLDVLTLVRSFLVDVVFPAEPTLAAGGAAAAACLADLQQRARVSGLWALPLPVALGGGGLDGPDEVHVQAVARRLLALHQGVSSTRPDSTASVAARK